MPHPNQSAWLKWLVSRNGFDTTRMERVTVSLLPDRSAIAVGEGSGLNDVWLRKMANQFDIVEFDKGWKNVSIYNPKGISSKTLGLIIGNDTIAIGQSDQPIFGSNPMRRFGNRFANNKAPNNISPMIAANLPTATDEAPPFLTLVATKNWRVPDADRSKLLLDYGVTLLVATVRIVGEEYLVEMTVTGESESRLKNEFVSLGLATHLIAKTPSLQPFVAPLSLATPETGTKDGKSYLKLSAKWPIADAQTWLDTLLGPAPVN